MVSADQVQRVVAELMPGWGTLEDISYLSGGYSNTNFAFTHAGSRYVLRMPKLVQPYVDRAREHAWYQDMPDQIGIKPVALDVRSGYMISPWVEGALLVDVWHQFSMEDLLGYLTSLHARLPSVAAIYDMVELSQAFWPEGQAVAGAELPVVRATCHNDLNPWNIIVSERGWLTLDWEFVGVNDPLFDLVALHQGLALPAEELPDLAISYLAGATTPSAALRRLAAAERNFWIRELGWAEFQIRHGNDRAEIREQAVFARQRLDALP